MTELELVQKIRAKYPRANPGGSPLGVDAWRAIVHVAQAFDAQVFRKDGGDHTAIPAGLLAQYPNGVSISRTIIGRGALGNRWVKVFGDGEGAAPAIWNIGDTPANGEYIDVSSIALSNDPPSQPPDQPPTTPPPTDLQPLVDRVAALEKEMRDLRIVPRAYAIQTAYGQYLCAENGGGGEVNATRTAAGTWESFMLVPK